MNRTLILPFERGGKIVLPGEFREVDLPCEVGQVSDGDHTFDDLYQHRNILFLALLSQLNNAWYSMLHSDGTSFEGWFIAGVEIEEGQMITYHLPKSDVFLSLAGLYLICLDKAPDWDGHTSEDVLERLITWMEKGAKKPPN